MTSDAAQAQAVPGGDIDIRIRPPRVQPDFSTIFGLIFALGLIVAAIAMGHSDANFVNGPSFLIVILGTMAATSVSYTGDELKHVPGIIGNTMLRRIRQPSVMAKQLMDIAMLSRKKGLLALSSIEPELRKDPFLARAVQLVTDGYNGEDIDRVLGQEVDAIAERHRRSASVLRRASEIAPAMGLIGTLVGLVQMLAQLDDPSSIGPAMAVALLTTFYGAIMGTVVLGPLSAKLERNSSDETMLKNLILTAMGSIARQENPRRLEMLLNSELPPEERIRYFD
ncbi:MAG: MotA/TolQ/ExbB proton channel family protein [Rhodospirillales bacterium]|nr:MotA/TolQ/ExbB proton channel family protein [Rhodospirillales bacterium]